MAKKTTTKSADVICQVVKEGYAAPYGTWLRVSSEEYAEFGPAGKGLLCRPPSGKAGGPVIDAQ